MSSRRRKRPRRPQEITTPVPAGLTAVQRLCLLANYTCSHCDPDPAQLITTENGPTIYLPHDHSCPVRLGLISPEGNIRRALAVCGSTAPETNGVDE
ncbi:hypothetical protein ACWCQW_47375 [Streptomyces mirabilis]